MGKCPPTSCKEGGETVQENFSGEYNCIIRKFLPFSVNKDKERYVQEGTMSGSP